MLDTVRDDCLKGRTLGGSVRSGVYRMAVPAEPPRRRASHKAHDGFAHI